MTSVMAAMIGRLMHHGDRRRQGYKIRWADLAWDIPIVIGMGFISFGVIDWLSLNKNQGIGVATALGYIGPRIIKVVIDKFMAKELPKD